MMSHTNIYKQNGKYVIIKVIYNKRITYGAYYTLDEAIKQRNKLRIYKWIKCRTTGYSKEESFPKYVVREDFKKNRYIVTNKETGKTFGAYNNQHYASIIKNILPYHQDDIDINHVERIAHKVFYKHISLNKRTNRYHVEYKSYVRGTYTNLVDALYERDIIVKYNGDEELMCEDTTTIYD
ncbi:MAG: hypothetical protein LUG89_01290, partial [Methanosphaera sp.]|nr:hypothetical protein [Methanosphaera sp.]